MLHWMEGRTGWNQALGHLCEMAEAEEASSFRMNQSSWAGNTSRQFRNPAFVSLAQLNGADPSRNNPSRISFACSVPPQAVPSAQHPQIASLLECHDLPCHPTRWVHLSFLFNRSTRQTDTTQHTQLHIRTHHAQQYQHTEERRYYSCVASLAVQKDLEEPLARHLW